MPALSQSAFSLGGSGIADLGAGVGDFFKAKGNQIEAENYEEASKFADLEAKWQHANTTVETAQIQRQVYQGLGRVQAGAASSGFTSGGSAGDLLRSSAQQGALQAATAKQTGQVSELGYEEQAKSYANMADAAKEAADAQGIAGITSLATGGLKLAGAALLL